MALHLMMIVHSVCMHSYQRYEVSKLDTITLTSFRLKITTTLKKDGVKVDYAARYSKRVYSIW